MWEIFKLRELRRGQQYIRRRDEKCRMCRRKGIDSENISKEKDETQNERAAREEGFEMWKRVEGRTG
jgi:hypothetical protein